MCREDEREEVARALTDQGGPLRAKGPKLWSTKRNPHTRCPRAHRIWSRSSRIPEIGLPIDVRARRISKDARRDVLHGWPRLEKEKEKIIIITITITKSKKGHQRKALLASGRARCRVLSLTWKADNSANCIQGPYGEERNLRSQEHGDGGCSIGRLNERAERQNT